jgi:hypothetical protein
MPFVFSDGAYINPLLTSYQMQLRKKHRAEKMAMKEPTNKPTNKPTKDGGVKK